MTPATVQRHIAAQTRGTASPSSPGPSGAPAKGLSSRHYVEAQRRARLVAEYRALLMEGFKAVDAADLMRAKGERCSRSTLDRWAEALEACGMTGLMDGRTRSGRKRQRLVLSGDELARVRARVLATTNRTADSGSVPEALRQAAARGEISESVCSEWEMRDRAGLGVPDSLRRDLLPSAAAVRQLRGPTDAGLDYLCAPGSLMWIRDSEGGPERPVRVGDVLEADDATVNFAVCVPWELGGDRCSDRWGVRVARFQWLVAIDRASRFIPGWSYVMRPRSSYRKEDILSMFLGVFRQHGVWSRLCLERGTWESEVVSRMIEGLGVRRMTAWTPHQKAFIEGTFNSLWTKLGTVPGQVGRSQGEEERAAAIVRSCQEGATDPRLHFPMLSDALAALRSATAERNAQAIHSPNYGSWVPEERWAAQLAEARERGRLRPLADETAWLFAPEAREWTVQGGTVGGSVQLMEGCSVRYDFAADWLPQYSGHRVRCHFDPAGAPEATLVLLENSRDRSAGEVLGVAVQINKVARYARRVLGYGDDQDLGREMRKAQAAAMRSEVRTILPGGATGLSVSQLRDGDGRGISIETNLAQRDGSASTPDDVTTPSRTAGANSGAAPAVHRRATNPLARATPEEFRRRSSFNAALAAAVRGDAEE